MTRNCTRGCSRCFKSTRPRLYSTGTLLRTSTPPSTPVAAASPCCPSHAHSVRPRFFCFIALLLLHVVPNVTFMSGCAELGFNAKFGCALPTGAGPLRGAWEGISSLGIEFLSAAFRASAQAVVAATLCAVLRADSCDAAAHSIVELKVRLVTIVVVPSP